MMRPLRAVAVAATLASLAGCSAFEKQKEPPACPRVSVLADAAKLTRFQPGPGRDITDIEVEAEVSGFQGTCKYDWDKKVMTIDMQVGIDARRGPAARGRQADIAYFVAMPAFYPDPKAKILFPVALAFPEGTDQVRYTDEEVEVTLPIKNLDDLIKYDVVLGLQLSPDQLDYNRRQKAAK